jgi:hypothetical protein
MKRMKSLFGIPSFSAQQGCCRPTDLSCKGRARASGRTMPKPRAKAGSAAHEGSQFASIKEQFSTIL